MNSEDKKSPLLKPDKQDSRIQGNVTPEGEDPHPDIKGPRWQVRGAGVLVIEVPLYKTHMAMTLGSLKLVEDTVKLWYHNYEAELARRKPKLYTPGVMGKIGGKLTKLFNA